MTPQTTLTKSPGQAGYTQETPVARHDWVPRRTDGGRWTINSIGRVGHGDHDYLIAVVSEHHTSMAGGVEAVEEVSELVTAALSKASAAGSA